MYDAAEFLSRTESVFHAVLSAPEDTRESVLLQECAGNALLIAEVRSLLGAAEDEERVSLSRYQSRRTGNFPPGGAQPDTARRIGPYQLERLLGRGGMGAVYLAHRADGQFRQQVAIKLIDLPLATDLFRDRFRMERQILAGLVHPYIARLLDGGVTPDGDLYLAMEYVDGLSITRFCDLHNKSLRERLMLFRSVCEAVQFAHQNLIVHRDLKPDNILVLADGTPRLLDFGTAKILSPGLTGPSLSGEDLNPDLTRQGFHSFTPQFASPEQILGNPITTASDTYSLGVLLYLLLTGQTPYTLQEFSTAEMVRVICTEPPRRPNLDPDLDAILLKSLRKEPQDRYPSAEQFSADIDDYLAGRAVRARSGSFRYRAGKFIRRNRLALAAAALLFLSLTAGIIGVAWQAHVANLERRKSEARSADLRELSNSLLSELDEAIKDLPGSTGAQKLLVTRVLEHLDRMARDSAGDRDSQLELIDAYTRLGNIQGAPYEQNLGDKPGALATIAKAIAIAQPLANANPADKAVLRELARAQDARGEILGDTTDIQGAVDSLRAASLTYDNLLALPAASPAEQSAIILSASTANSLLGDVLGQDTGLADVAAALASYQKSLQMDQRALALEPSSLRIHAAIANMHMKIGNAELDIDPATALPEFQLALDLTDKLPESEKVKVNALRLRGITVRKIGCALSELGEYAQATAFFEQSLAIHQKLADADPKDVRNWSDIKRALQAQALNFQYQANPALAGLSNQPHAATVAAQRSLAQVLDRYRANLELTLKLAPASPDRVAELANVQARLASARNDPSAVRQNLTALRNAAASPSASPMLLDLVAQAFLGAQPVSARDPQFTLFIARRGAEITHRKAPSWMLALAQAERAASQPTQARATATEGLTLLPPTTANKPKSRIRKQLELEAGGKPSF
jgi:serine/threonine protein kinase